MIKLNKKNKNLILKKIKNLKIKKSIKNILDHELE